MLVRECSEDCFGRLGELSEKMARWGRMAGIGARCQVCVHVARPNSRCFDKHTLDPSLNCEFPAMLNASILSESRAVSPPICRSQHQAPRPRMLYACERVDGADNH